MNRITKAEFDEFFGPGAWDKREEYRIVCQQQAAIEAEAKIARTIKQVQEDEDCRFLPSPTLF